MSDPVRLEFHAGQAPYLIAEMSGNHKGEIERALRLIDAAKEAGADAVKLQTYTADTITLKSDRPEFQIHGGPWDGRSLHELYEEAHTPWAWHPQLFAHAASIGITLFSSPFDPTAVDLLDRLGAPAFKIASYEIVDLPLIRYAASKGKPLIISTGMATLGEIDDAVTAARGAAPAGTPDPVLLHCTSGYPTPHDECDLRTIPHLAQAFGVPTGLSDHTHGIAVPVAAVALGAVVIEKHLTLSRAEGGVDASFSLEPAEFKAMAESCRVAHAALGAVGYAVKPSEAGGRAFRRSLYVAAPVKAGEVFTPANVRSVRPGLGLAPKHLDQVLGARATRDLDAGQPLDWGMVQPS
ncbi:pseudaminic acid synthase [Nitrospirillum iridis]|uniref:N-acetylneuraminate synthase n=1 Tax=Nitrospirillum iridis TaxID=765888 RepID=A0A7X0B050_9PROT|nr:pseudaminic acid synthase [Nitrospirillum iridis]MBB6252235.1 N-acetylneuraminate synthase [Nitrospirillum iridis]